MTRYTNEEIEEIKRETDPECPLFLYCSKSVTSHYLAQATEPPTAFGIGATFESADGTFPHNRTSVVDGLFSRATIDQCGFEPLTPAAEDVMALFEELEKEADNGQPL